MAHLTIKDNEVAAQCDFNFDMTADEKYNERDEKGNKTGGFMNIYLGLMNFDNNKLVAFWDCALAYLHKDKPSKPLIQSAIMDRINQDQDTEGLFQEAFRAIEESGFYKRQAKKFWENIETLKDAGDTEEKKAENLKAYNVMMENRKALIE